MTLAFGYVCNPVTVVTTWDVEPRKLSLNLSNHQYATTLAVWKYVWHTFMDGIHQKLTVQWISFSWWICNVSFFVKTQRYAFLLWRIFEKGAQKDLLSSFQLPIYQYIYQLLFHFIISRFSLTSYLLLVSFICNDVARLTNCSDLSRELIEPMHSQDVRLC